MPMLTTAELLAHCDELDRIETTESAKKSRTALRSFIEGQPDHLNKWQSLVFEACANFNEAPDPDGLIDAIRGLHAQIEQLETVVIGLEDVTSEAPAKEPRNYPTVGFVERHRNVDPEAADEAITQAFNEGHSRGLWEAAHKIDILTKKAK